MIDDSTIESKVFSLLYSVSAERGRWKIGDGGENTGLADALIVIPVIDSPTGTSAAMVTYDGRTDEKLNSELLFAVLGFIVKHLSTADGLSTDQKRLACLILDVFNIAVDGEG